MAVGQQHCVVEQHSLVFPLGMGLLSQADLSACSQQCHRHHNSPSTAAARNWGNAFPDFPVQGHHLPRLLRGKPGYLLLLAPGQLTPGWEGFLTLWKKHPHHQKHKSRAAQFTGTFQKCRKREGTAHLYRAPSCPQSRDNPLESRMSITPGSRQ